MRQPQGISEGYPSPLWAVRFELLWRRLTDPPPAIVSPLERERARLLSSILILFLPLVIALIIFLQIVSPENLHAPVLSGLALVVAYFASRTRFYNLVALLVVMVIVAEPLAEALAVPPQIAPLPFVAIAILLAGILLEGWYMIGVTSITLAVLVILPVINLFLDPDDVLPSLILAVITAVVTVAANAIRALYRTELEQRTRQIAESEREFRLIADHASDMIVRCTPDGWPLYVSPSSRAILGYEPAEILQQSTLDLVYPEDQAMVRDFVRHVEKDDQAAACVFRMPHYDGRLLWFEMQGRRAQRHDGQFEIITIVRDISDRKRVEQGLRNAEYHNRALMNAIPDVILVLTRSGVYVDARSAVKEDLVAPPERLIGAHLYDFFPPEQAAPMLAGIQRALDTRSLQTLKYTILTQRGMQSFEARYVALDHEQDQVLVIVRNISEQEETERTMHRMAVNLREQMAMLDTVLAATPDLLLILNRHGSFMYANPTALRYLQRELNQVIGRSWSELGLNAEAIDQLDRDHEQVIVNRKPVSSTVQVTVSGQTVDLSYTGSPILDGGGQVTTVVMTIRDISQLRKTESERLELAVQRERVQMLRHLISDTSHDMKTPLTALNTSLYLLQKSMSDPERRARYTSALQDQIVHLTQLLDEMNGIAKLESGNVTYELEPLEVGAFISRLISDHEPLALQKNQQLSFERTDSALMVRLDASKFWRAASNIIGNAMKYTPDDGLIAVRVWREQQDAIIEVRDSGIGIATEELPHIFERAYRARNTEEAHASGHGLGLTITRQIVEGHGGRVEADSVIGQGSVFRIILPLLPD
jgi:PAS domain S-box-containing protein